MFWAADRDPVALRQPDALSCGAARVAAVAGAPSACDFFRCGSNRLATFEKKLGVAGDG